MLKPVISLLPPVKWMYISTIENFLRLRIRWTAEDAHEELKIAFHQENAI